MDVAVNDTLDRGMLPSQKPRASLLSDTQKKILNALLENDYMSERDFKLKFGDARFDNSMRSVTRLVERGFVSLTDQGHHVITDKGRDTLEG